MVSELEFNVVDAVSERRYSGNPAAVVFGADGLEDQRLQAIATEFNLSATTFVLSSETPEAAIRFRWFTPSTEVQMCGHATLAGVHALLERGCFTSMLEQPKTPLVIQTAADLLRVQTERTPPPNDQLLFWLDLPTPQLTSRSVNIDRLTEILGMDLARVDSSLPVMETQDEDLIVFVESYPALVDARPHFTQLGAWCVRHRVRGICLATVNTLAPSAHVQSRFFAPAFGVNEDPVSGSVHGPLAAYLVAHELVPCDGREAAVTCVQAEAGGRAGLIRALVTEEGETKFSVKIAGQCQTTMRGKLML